MCSTIFRRYITLKSSRFDYNDSWGVSLFLSMFRCEQIKGTPNYMTKSNSPQSFLEIILPSTRWIDIKLYGMWADVLYLCNWNKKNLSEVISKIQLTLLNDSWIWHISSSNYKGDARSCIICSFKSHIKSFITDNPVWDKATMAYYYEPLLTSSAPNNG